MRPMPSFRTLSMPPNSDMLPDLQRVAVYYSNQDIRIEPRPLPSPGPGEILIRVHASGICGSDVMEWYRKPQAPRVLGHEVSGTVVAVGSAHVPFRAGDRVMVTHHVPCMVCRFCQTGRHTHCEFLHRTSFDPGGFAEYIRVPAPNVIRGTLPIPDSVSDESASMVEPLGCVIRAQRKIRLNPGQTVLILGSGISGLLHLLAARAQGAGPLFVTDIVPFRLETALKLGADAAYLANDEPVRKIREFLGRGVDVAIVCTGALPAINQALDAIDPGGTVLFFAPTNPEDSLNLPFNRTFWQNGITLTSSYGASLQDLQSALDLITWKRIDPSPLITHRLPLSKILDGFQFMIQVRDSLKIIIDPRLDSPTLN